MSGSRALTIAAWLAGGCTALYAALAGAAFFGQRALLYPAPSHPIEPRAAGAELLRLPGSNGTVVYALYSPAPAGAPTIVHFHGNGEDLARQSLLIQDLQRAGLGACAVEYPGYGLARDAPLNEHSVYAAAEASLRHLAELGVRRESIILQGQSLGSGVAVEMARRGHGTKLVLISPYTSIVDMAALVVPYLPVRWLVRDRYDTAEKASSLALPALVIHGTDDEVVPFRMGQRVAVLLPRAELIRVPGGHHNDLFEQNEVDVMAAIIAFARGDTAAKGVEPRR